jgi:hypothetical protein
MSDAEEVKLAALNIVEQLESIEKTKDLVDDQIRDVLYKQLQEGTVEGSDEDLASLRAHLERIDELTEWDLLMELDDGTDPLDRLRDAIQEMMDIEDGGDIYGDDYEYYADLVGLRLDDHQGCWTYADGECMDAGSQMMDALNKLQETGKQSGLTGGEMLSNFAYNMKIKLPS